MDTAQAVRGTARENLGTDEAARGTASGARVTVLVNPATGRDLPAVEEAGGPAA